MAVLYINYIILFSIRKTNPFRLLNFFYCQTGPAGPHGYPGPPGSPGSPGYCESCNYVYGAGRPPVAGNFKGPWTVQNEYVYN